MKKLVKIVIPIYREVLDGVELRSVRHNMEVLGRYPMVLLMPEGVAVPQALRGCRAEVLRVSDDWLGTKRGIAGYNAMMMAKEFYDLFADTEYILICQSDVWIFRDELEAWCQAGYDYVGAPWLKRPHYEWPPVKLYLQLRRWLYGRTTMLRQYTFNRVGNGGLSLRRVASHRDACVRYAAQIEYFTARRKHIYNEDVFWSIIPEEFRYPSLEQALRFSFDVDPAYCYRCAGGKLPFGCHGWYKQSNHRFWQMMIGKS